MSPERHLSIISEIPSNELKTAATQGETAAKTGPRKKQERTMEEIQKDPYIADAYEALRTAEEAYEENLGEEVMTYHLNILNDQIENLEKGYEKSHVGGEEKREEQAAWRREAGTVLNDIREMIAHIKKRFWGAEKKTGPQTIERLGGMKEGIEYQTKLDKLDNLRQKMDAGELHQNQATLKIDELRHDLSKLWETEPISPKAKALYTELLKETQETLRRLEEYVKEGAAPESGKRKKPERPKALKEQLNEAAQAVQDAYQLPPEKVTGAHRMTKGAASSLMGIDFEDPYPHWKALQERYEQQVGEAPSPEEEPTDEEALEHLRTTLQGDEDDLPTLHRLQKPKKPNGAGGNGPDKPPKSNPQKRRAA